MKNPNPPLPRFLLFAAGIVMQLMSTSSILLAQSSPVALEPTVPASFLTASGANCNEIDLSWVSGDGTRRLVLASANVPVSAVPVDGQAYSAATNFGSGSNLGSGNYVVYNSNGTGVTVSGLNGGVQYYFAVFEFNGTGGGINYLTSVYPTADTIATGIALSVTVSDSAFCLGDFAQLEVHGAPQYQWSPGTGLSSTTDSVVTASPVTTTQYTVLASDPNGCQVSSTLTLTVYSLPVVNLGNFSDICRNGSPIVLSGGTPSGGTYTGPGVSGGIFDPAVAGGGIHTITYRYTNAQGCSSADSSTIRVNNPPTVNLSTFLDVCVNSSPFNLSGGTPGGGFYTGPGVSGATFDPSLAGEGTHFLVYTYTNVQGCSASDTSTITVNPLPVVSLNSYSPLCIDATPLVLSGGSPVGGTYTGAGVSGGSFNPTTAGAGNQLITYTYTDSNGCTASALSSIQVNALPVVTVSPFAGVCENSTPFLLSGGSPVGGIYAGSAVSNDSFAAAIAGPGAHFVTYTYTDGNGCTNSDSSELMVFNLPVVTFSSLPSVCANTGPVTLSGGSPAGGNYSGPAVGGTSFYTGIAGPGTHTILYTYTDSNSCTNSASQTIQVNVVPQPNLGPDTIVCAEGSIVLTAGNMFSTYAWSTGQNTSSITVDTAGHGLGTSTFVLIVTNSFGCANRDTVRVTFTPCAGLLPVPKALYEVSVSPNPSSFRFHLLLPAGASVFISDMQGRSLPEMHFREGENFFGETFERGMYFVNIELDGFRRVIRLIKE